MIPVDDDDGADRFVWTIKECPFAHSCSSASWKKMMPWSIEDPHNCLHYLKYHLIYSGKHNMSEEQADDEVKAVWKEGSLAWSETIDTHKDRMWYRQQIDQAQAEYPAARPKKKSRHDETSSSRHERTRTPSPEFEDDALGVVEVAREEELEARLVAKLGANIATCIRQSYKRSTDMALIS